MINISDIYITKDDKELLLNRIFNKDIDIEKDNIYLVNLDTKYNEPYVEYLAEVNIGTINYLLNDNDIIFIVNNKDKRG